MSKTPTLCAVLRQPGPLQTLRSVAAQRIEELEAALPPLRAGGEEIARALIREILDRTGSGFSRESAETFMLLPHALAESGWFKRAEAFLSLCPAAQEEWRDISSAKFDGNAIWLLVGGQPYIGYGEHADWLCKKDRWFVKASFRRRSLDKREGFSDEIYCVHGVDVAPTHWMPLPIPPVAEPKALVAPRQGTT